MPQVRDIEWEACLLEPRSNTDLERRFKKATGRSGSGGPVVYFTTSDWAGDALIELNAQAFTRVHIDDDLADMAGMVVSQDNSCRYCYAATRALLRIMGMPEERISELERDLLTAEIDERQRHALEFSRRLSHSNPLPDAAEIENLRAHGFSREEITELAATVAINVFFVRVATLLALPSQSFENLPDRWWVRLLRPLIAIRLRSFRVRSKPVTLTEDERQGPFSRAVCALDGLPTARAFRRAIDSMWNSKTLSRRARALTFAVVARALGCSGNEAEARRLLIEDGLADDEIDRILDDLASPVLDEVESLIVPFARETVWYQPARLQRRARDLLSKLSEEQFVDFIAVAALANATCRLEVIMERAE